MAWPPCAADALRTCGRGRQAHLEIGEKATVRLAIQEYQKALELDPDNRRTPHTRTTSLTTYRITAQLMLE